MRRDTLLICRDGTTVVGTDTLNTGRDTLLRRRGGVNVGRVGTLNETGYCILVFILQDLFPGLSVESQVV